MEKETLEEAAEKHYEEQSREFENNTDNPIFDTSRYLVAGFIDGAKWQAERMYSEEDMRKCWDACTRFDRPISEGDAPNFNELIEQFKK